jgi:hypothetical protein
MENSEKYNGWANRETWLFNVWYGDFINSYEDYLVQKDLFEEEHENLINTIGTCIWSDLIDTNLIDWKSLEETYKDKESEGFFENYKPIYNHIEHKQYKERQTNGNNIGADMYFETYGEDLKYVQSHDTQFIWTLIEIDGVQYIVQGFHYVNRLNYFIASVPYSGGQEEFLYMDFKQLNY